MGKWAAKELRSNATHKYCYVCKTLKERSLFSSNVTKRDGLRTECKMCEASRQSKVKSKVGYDIDQTTYDTIKLQQDNKCAICKSTSERALAIDHNHNTGEIRGLLCTKCNLGLGNFRDDIALLEAAIEYLKQDV